MNDHDLDALGRRAAAELRTDAEAVAGSPEALARLLADQAPANAASTVAATTLPHGGSTSARRWRVLTAAAVLVTIVVGLAWLARSGSGTIDIVGPGPGTGSGAPQPTAATTSPPDATADPAATSAPGSGASSSTATATSVPPSRPTSAPGTSVPGDRSDPLAGITPPPGATAPTIDDVPTLLPSAPADPGRTMMRDSESGPQPATLSQLWVRADPDGRVDAVVQLTTRLAPASPPPGGDLVIVAGWPDARRYESDAGSVFVSLVAPTGVVDARSYGLDEQVLLDLAAGLRPGASGWASATLATEPWLAVDSTWTTGSAARTLVSLDAGEGDVDSEVAVLSGSSMADAAPGFLYTTVDVVEVRGRTGLLFRGGVGALIIRHDDTTIVRLASRDPDADLVSVAESLVEVDRSDWEAAAGLTVDVDGCIGFFC
jgi:hypothetical protein